MNTVNLLLSPLIYYSVNYQQNLTLIFQVRAVHHKSLTAHQWFSVYTIKTTRLLAFLSQNKHKPWILWIKTWNSANCWQTHTEKQKTWLGIRMIYEVTSLLSTLHHVVWDRHLVLVCNQRGDVIPDHTDHPVLQVCVGERGVLFCSSAQGF